MKTMQAEPRPELSRGALVLVSELGIKPWIGQLLSLKFSPVSGWWAEVRRDDGATFSIPADVVTLAAGEPRA